MLRLIKGEGTPPLCSFCLADPLLNEEHSEECKQNWRDIILGYKAK